jgi:hypothetical protein
VNGSVPRPMQFMIHCHVFEHTQHSISLHIHRRAFKTRWQHKYEVLIEEDTSASRRSLFLPYETVKWMPEDLIDEIFSAGSLNEIVTKIREHGFPHSFLDRA